MVKTQEVLVDANRRKFLKRKHFKTSTLPALITVGPIALWLLALIVIPMAYVVVISFMQQGAFGYIQYHLTIQNYTDMFQPLYIRVFAVSFAIAAGATAIVLLLAYPLAYFIARHKKQGGFLLFLMMIPSWTIGLVRTYSWVKIMQNNGIINNILMSLHIIREPLQIMYTGSAVTFGTIYELFVFAVLPLYSSIEKLDESCLEASKDLGARPFQTLRTVILPLTSGGIFASVILTFIPALGIYIVADIFGGGTILYLGNLIRNQMLETRNWPFGSALSVVLIVLTMILLYLFTRFYKLEDLEV